MAAAGAQAAQVPSPLASRASPAAAAILHFFLFATVFSSGLTFTDPSLHEALVLPLLVACVAARVPIDLRLMPYLGLWVVYLAAGLAALAPVISNASARIYFAFSVLLVVTGVLYGCLFAQDSERRFAIMRTALVLSCTIAALLGIAGYFRLVPGELFTMYGRASGPTVQPNIFGALLVFPLLLVFERFITHRVTPGYALAGCIILLGLLLSFSRGSWTNFTVATLLTLVLIFLATDEARIRRRAIAFAVGAVLAGAVLLSIALSIPAVWEMFELRFRLLQEYDVGDSGARFSIQAAAVEEILRNPNGLGPNLFARTYGSFTHNSFLGTTLNHGWLGGAAYLALVLSTLAVGLRAAFIVTRWQSFLIVSWAAFFGTVLHSFVEDPERQRPFYLFIGLVWGLSVASLNARRARLAAAPPPTIAEAAPRVALRPAPADAAGVFRIRLSSP